MLDEKELTIKEIEDSWDALTDFEKRAYLETQEFSKEFLEANWEDMNWEQRCLTGRQERGVPILRKSYWDSKRFSVLADFWSVSMF